MNAEHYFNIGRKYFLDDNFEKALENLMISNELEDMAVTKNLIGCCYIHLDNLKAAEDIFCKMINYDPTWQRPFYNLGRVYAKYGRTDEAIQCFEKALEIGPDENDNVTIDADIYFSWGLCYHNMNEYEKAMDYYKKAISIDNKDPEAHLNLGWCYFHFRNYDKALEEFELAYRYDHDCINALYGMGEALMIMKKYDKALVYFVEFSKHLPNDEDTIKAIAHCQHKIAD